MPYRKVLCAVELGDGNESVIEKAAAIARANNAKLTLLHVVEHFPEDRSNVIIAPEDQDPEDYERRRVRDLLCAAATQAGADSAEYDVRFTSNSADAEIVDCANGGAYDLVVLGSRHHRGLAAFLLSTSEGVVHRAICDVLVVNVG